MLFIKFLFDISDLICISLMILFLKVYSFYFSLNLHYADLHKNIFYKLLYLIIRFSIFKRHLFGYFVIYKGDCMMVSPTGFEPVALELGILRSIQLSYEDNSHIL